MVFRLLLSQLKAADAIEDRVERLGAIAEIANISSDDPAYLTMFVLQDAAAHRQARAARVIEQRAVEVRDTMLQIEKRVGHVTDRLSMAAALLRCWPVVAVVFVAALALGFFLNSGGRRASAPSELSQALNAAEIVRQALGSEHGQAVADFIEAGELIPVATCAKQGWKKENDACAPFPRKTGATSGWFLRRPR